MRYPPLSVSQHGIFPRNRTNHNGIARLLAGFIIEHAESNHNRFNLAECASAARRFRNCAWAEFAAMRRLRAMLANPGVRVGIFSY